MGWSQKVLLLCLVLIMLLVIIGCGSSAPDSAVEVSKVSVSLDIGKIYAGHHSAIIPGPFDRLDYGAIIATLDAFEKETGQQVTSFNLVYKQGSPYGIDGDIDCILLTFE